MNDRLLRRSEVLARVPVAPSTLYKMMEEENFPRPIKITSKAVAWRESAINEWLEGREALSA